MYHICLITYTFIIPVYVPSRVYLWIPPRGPGGLSRECVLREEEEEENWLFNVTINDISVIYVTAQMCRRTEEEV